MCSRATGTKPSIDPPTPNGTPPHGDESRHSVSLPPDEHTSKTIAIWQPKTAQVLTTQDAVEMSGNITRFFTILSEWDRARADATGGRPTDGVDKPGAQTPDENTNRVLRLVGLPTERA